MMFFQPVVLSSFAIVAAAVPLKSAVNVETRAAVTDIQFANFKLFAEYSGAAYCPNNDNNTGGLITCSGGVCPTVESNGAVSIVEFQGTAATDQQGFVAIDPVAQLIVVSLRGTDSLVDFIDDILFLYTSCDFVDGCEAHAGFYGNWLASKTTIVNAVTTATKAHPTYNLVVTGHSLGAAVATLAAAYLRENGFPCDLYTYGSPRVGNGVLADFVSNQPGITARITHYDDPIPRLPPIIFTYRHTSPEYWLSGGTSTTNNYNASDVVICLGDANTNCNAGEGGLDTTAHFHYLLTMDACAPDLTLDDRDDSGLISSDRQSQSESFGALDKAYSSALVNVNASRMRL